MKTNQITQEIKNESLLIWTRQNQVYLQNNNLHRFSQSRLLQFELCFTVMYRSKWAVSNKDMPEYSLLNMVAVGLRGFFQKCVRAGLVRMYA